jgi:hypothetical protein
MNTTPAAPTASPSSLRRALAEVLQVRSLQWVSLAATLYLCFHAELQVGRWIGLGDSAWAIPVAVDCYVVLALAVERQAAPALLTLMVSAGGGDFLIGWKGAPTDAERLLRGSVAAAVGVGLVLVLWQCERLATHGAAERHALAAQAVRHAAELAGLRTEHAAGLAGLRGEIAQLREAHASQLATVQSGIAALQASEKQLAEDRDAHRKAADRANLRAEEALAELDELQRIVKARGIGPQAPAGLADGDRAHLPNAKAAAAALVERGEAVTRDALIAEMKAAGKGVGTERAGRLLAAVRA